MTAVCIIFIFAFAACIGSFLNVVIYRLPRGQSLSFPASHCPTCGTPIHWFDNIPLISWCALKGHCRSCKASISPRYLAVEATTALLATGLFVALYILHLRDGMPEFSESWPTFIAHAALLAGLLACSLIDMEHWIVPLELCWVLSILGILAAAAAPPPAQILTPVSPPVGAAGLAAIVGLAISLILLRTGFLRRSFLDADDKPVVETRDKDKSGKSGRITSVAATKEHGVNPRLEMLHEVLFLLPAIALAALAYLLVEKVPAINSWWTGLNRSDSWALANSLAGVQAAVFGYLVGGAWIWGMRIFGTIGFGKEAMGLGDVHILAAVGAVCGWATPSIVFFLAPFFGLIWAFYLLLSRKQRELPYGPWLAAATLVVIVFYDPIIDVLKHQFGPILQ